MITKELENLLAELRASTERNSIQWEKGEGQFSYVFTARSQKFLVDKYFSVFNLQTNMCYSVTIFNDGNLIEEIVSCKIDGLDSEFKILEDLYKSVERNFFDKKSQHLSPIFNDITQSLRSS